MTLSDDTKGEMLGLSVDPVGSPGRPAPVAPPAEGGVPEFRAVFDAHADFVGRTLRYLGVPAADLDDALQQVFLVVNARLAELEKPEALRAWLRQIAHRIAMATRRKRAARREELGESAPHPPFDARATPDAAHARRNLLLRWLDELTDDQREVFVTYEIEEMSMREVAELVGCPLQTAYSRYKSARECLEQAARRDQAR
ncbi:hypothetical protein BH09MYX1_BH09MYX1_57900 [soil metagenome]